MIETLEKKVDDGLELTPEEALWLAEEAPLEELCEAAHRITLKYASHKFDMCSIINAKSGRCSEDCKWCRSNCGLPEVITSMHSQTLCSSPAL